MAPFNVPQTVAAAVAAGLYRLNSGDAEIGITATGANQAAAYALTKRVSVVTGGNTAGVRLPAGVGAGDFYIVVNATGTNPGAGLSNFIACYPASGETVRPNGVDVRNYQCANTLCIYVSRGDGTWQCGTMDMKSDAISRTVTDHQYFYGAGNFYNGLSVSTGGTFDVSVAATFTSSARLSARARMDGKISPTALGAGPTADYNPTGLSTCNVIRQDMSAAGVVSGLTAQTDGTLIYLANIATSVLNTLTLTHDDAASTAANRFYLPGNASLVIPNNGGAWLWYDGTSSRWRTV